MTTRISLEGKVAVVTGAGRGLGRAYVELLAERGARVVVNDLGTDVSGFGKDSTVAEQEADLIRSRGGEAIAYDSDVSTPEGGSDLIATTIEHFGCVRATAGCRPPDRYLPLPVGCECTSARAASRRCWWHSQRGRRSTEVIS